MRKNRLIRELAQSPRRIAAAAPSSPGSTVWTADAYAPGNYSLWSGTQVVSGNRAQVVTPPVEVGGGPRNRSYIGRYRIEAADGDPFGNPSAQRTEAVRFHSDGIFQGRSCQGGEIWVAWESYFGDPSVVADTNAYRPNTGSDWNMFSQWHQNAGLTTQPMTFYVDAKSGTAPAGWRFGAWTRGGVETSPTGIVKHDLGAFSYGWHEIKAYINWAQASGRLKVWLDTVLAVDYTGPVGFNPDSTGGTCNYWKQGMYRGKKAVNMTVFHAGTRMGTTEQSVG